MHPRPLPLTRQLAAIPGVALLASVLLLPVPHASAFPQVKRPANGLQIVIGGMPGPLNAITDVAGVEVGHTTLIEGQGPLVVGQGPVRTGVTAVLPRGKAGPDSVFAGWSTLNGNGEMTGTIWLEESGFLEGPVLITNTHSVGVVRDAATEWMVHHRPRDIVPLPVVAETHDGTLNDAQGFHVKREHAMAALDGAKGGAVAEGNVGGGTGMTCHGLKGGIGTASRRVTENGLAYAVGVLVQCNYGTLARFQVAGVPLGPELQDLARCLEGNVVPSREWLRTLPRCGTAVDPASAVDSISTHGSIIVIVATDAPLLPHQLKRVARRVALGIGRMGGLGENGSGDIFLAFSTANSTAFVTEGTATIEMLPNDRIDPIFEATVQATE